MAALAPTWLACLPLATCLPCAAPQAADGGDGGDDGAGQVALAALCQLLADEASSRWLVGADGANLPRLLEAIGAAFETADAGEEGSAQLQRVVGGWKASGAPLFQACRAAMPQEPVVRAKLERMGLQ